MHTICQQNSAVPTDWKRSVFIPVPKKGNAKEWSNYHAIAFISDTSKITVKIFQVGFSNTLAWKIPWTQEPGRVQSMGLLRAGHDWSDFTFTSLSPCTISCKEVFEYVGWKNKANSAAHFYWTEAQQLIWLSFNFRFQRAVGQGQQRSMIRKGHKGKRKRMNAYSTLTLCDSLTYELYISPSTLRNRLWLSPLYRWSIWGSDRQ